MFEGIPQSRHPLDLIAAERDLWPGGTLALWRGEDAPQPALVCWPEDEAQACAALREASERGLAVVPYGAGSGVSGGARGVAGSVVIDTKRLDRIGPLDEARMAVRVEAGVNGQHLEDWLNARGYTLGHSPSSIWCSTVGGWAAARSAGQFSSYYGVFEDMVLSLRAATPGAGLIEVGLEGTHDPRWMPLLLGSEGTLGVITSMWVRVAPLPEARWLRGYRFADMGEALSAMRRLMQRELWPSVVRLYDPVDTRIGGKTRPKRDKPEGGGAEAFLKGWLAAVDRLPALKRRTLTLPLSLPGLVNTLFDRAASGCFLVVGWEGEPEAVRVRSEHGHRLLTRAGEDLGEEPGWRWYRSRHAVSYKMMPIFERGGFADTMEVACRWSSLRGLYEAVREAVKDDVVIMAHMSHVYPEGGSIYFSFAGRGDREVYERTWRHALQAVLEAGATVTHHHGVGELKKAYASREVGVAVEGWRELKAALDPAGVLNPGRLFERTPYQDPGPPPRLSPEDGLARAPLGASLEERREVAARMDAEPMFPWEGAAPPRWLRDRWEVGETEVAGELGGRRAVLGRGPRSASGSDLRGWLAERIEANGEVTFPVVRRGERWMGEGRPAAPWKAAQSLLRRGLRPACLYVSEEGALRVGFRGPAAADLGRVAASWIEGGLKERPWAPAALPSEKLTHCAIDDPRVIRVTAHLALRRLSEEEQAAEAQSGGGR